MEINHKIALLFKIRNANLSDVDEILALDHEVWPDFPATRDMIKSRIEVFPEGNFVTLYKGKIVGYLCLQFINYDLENHPSFTWNEITDNGTLRNSHSISNEYMYGLAMSVSPRFQDVGIGTRLIFAGWSLIVRYNKRGCMLGSRIPGYASVQSQYTPEQYMQLKREDGKLLDPELRLYENDGFKIVGLLPNYENDPQSCDYGVLVYQANPFFNIGWPWLRNVISKVIAKWGHAILGV